MLNKLLLNNNKYAHKTGYRALILILKCAYTRVCMYVHTIVHAYAYTKQQMYSDIPN